MAYTAQLIAAGERTRAVDARSRLSWVATHRNCDTRCSEGGEQSAASKSAPAAPIECIKPRQCQKRCHIPDVEHPPAGDTEDARPEARREVHHHIDDVAQPEHDVGPAGDDHPPVTPPLELDKAVRRHHSRREYAEDAKDLPALFAGGSRPARPETVVVEVIGGVGEPTPTSEPPPHDAGVMRPQVE